jgi:hypothetical protein
LPSYRRWALVIDEWDLECLTRPALRLLSRQDGYARFAFPDNNHMAANYPPPTLSSTDMPFALNGYAQPVAFLANSRFDECFYNELSRFLPH